MNRHNVPLSPNTRRKLTITVTQAMKHRLDREKLETGMSINEILGNAIEQFLNYPMDQRKPPRRDILGNHEF